MTEARILPPPPRPSSAGFVRPSAETNFWAGLFVDLDVRIEWLAQSLDAVPKEDASAGSLVRLRGYARALEDLRQALGGAQAHRATPILKPLFSLEGPLAGFLSRLYAWCEEIGEDFERMAVALRRREPTTIVFSHQEVNASYAHFNDLIASMRRANEEARAHATADGAPNWRAFEESIEELIWATEWVHMALACAPGT